MTFGWPWPILRQVQILQLMLLHRIMWQWWIFWKFLHPVTWNLVSIVNWMSKWRIMSNQGQGLLNHFYLGFVCCVLIRGPDIRWAFTGPLVLWFLVRFRLLCGHLLGYSCSLGWPYVLFVLLLFVLLVITGFDFEGWIWVLIASVPDLCILFTFTLDLGAIPSTWIRAYEFVNIIPCKNFRDIQNQFQCGNTNSINQKPVQI